MQQRGRTHRMTGVAVVLERADLGKIERLGTRHVGINEQYLIAIIQIGNVLDLQLHIVLALDASELHFFDACYQFRPERIVAAPRVAVSEQ